MSLVGVLGLCTDASLHLLDIYCMLLKKFTYYTPSCVTKIIINDMKKKRLRFNLHFSLKSWCYDEDRVCVFLNSSRVQTPTMAPKACGRLPTSPPDPAPKPASPSATPPATTTARPSRTARSPRSSSTHNVHRVLPYASSLGLGYR